MKRVFLYLLVVIVFMACTRSEFDIVYQHQTSDIMLHVGIESDDTRIQLDQVGKSVWNMNDRVSVFYKSEENQEWRYQGQTGDRTGVIAPTGWVKEPSINGDIIVVYPYDVNNAYSSESNIVTATVAQEQHYTANSYGSNGNILVAHSTSNNLSLKNVYGWLKIGLTGSAQTVKSITLTGNNGEQLAGNIVINTDDATAEFTTTNDPIQSIQLNCDKGIALSATPTSFYIGIIPQTFEKGITIEIESRNGAKMIKSTAKEVSIARRHILPMKAFEFKPEQTNPEQYKVGSLYDNGAVKGIIYAIKDFPVYNDDYTAIIRTDKYCYIFSLDEEDLQWSTKYEWCNCTSQSGDNNSSDPFNYWEQNIDDYPAFKWCKEHGEGWFLPSSTELNWIWEAITNGARDFAAPSVVQYNKLITDNGGEPFCETFYWSSNETSEDLVEVIAFMNDSVVCLDPKKDNFFTARAVYRFKIE